MDAIRDLTCQYVEEHDLVSLYLAGRLSEEEAEAFEKHYFGCERCWAEVKAGEEIRAALKGGQAPEALSPQPPPKVRRGPWVGWRVLAIAAGIAAAAVGGLLLVQIGDRADVRKLAASLDFKSPVEARLATFRNGGRDAQRSTSVESTRPSGEALEAIGRIQSRARKNPTAANMAALGVAQLVLGDDTGAVTSLERATNDEPGNATFWSDLSAAYLAAGLSQKALSAAEKAITIEPSITEARFNRALALEKLPLRDQARQAWQEYLRHDSTTPWAEEARQHLQRLPSNDTSFSNDEKSRLSQAARAGDRTAVEEIVGRFPTSSREYLEMELLPEWAATRLRASDDPDSSSLTTMRLIADAHAQATGDPMLREAVEAIEHAGAVSAAQLARGHLDYRDGKRLYDTDEMREAERILDRAQRDLRSGRSPFSSWARFYASTSRYYRGDRGESVEDLKNLAAVAARRHYTLLQAGVRWIEAWGRGVDGDLTGAIHQYLLALADFERAGDRSACAVIHSHLAEIYDLLGDPTTAWQHRQEGLKGLDWVASPVLSHSILVESTYAALAQNLDSLAFHFQSALAARPRDGIGPTAGSEDELLMAQIQQRLGKTEVARGCLIRAKKALSRLSDSDLARRANAEISLAEGQVNRPSAPRVSIASLTRAIEYFRASRSLERLPELYLERGRAQLALGLTDRAREDFASGIQVFEEQRSLQKEYQIPYFERAWDLFDEMIRLEAVVRRDPVKALAFAERARARDLLSRLGNPRFLPPDELRAELAEGITLVYYCSLNDRLLTWTVTKTSARFFDSGFSSERLTRLIDRYRAALQEGRSAEEVNDDSAELYDALVGPFAASLPPGSIVVFLPHGPLHGVPFASLRSRTSKRYLVQDYVIGVAPSGNVLVRTCRRMRALGRPAAPAVLAVGNPRVDRQAFPGLPDLPEARVEARAIAALYPRTETLVDSDATAARFWTGVAKADVVHFAGHALVNPGYPSLSRLMFAAPDSDADHGVVFAKQIYEHPLTRTHLAVLAACETGSGPSLSSEGVISLARPFLAAGVPQVVASLWRVDDRASRDLLSRFHRYYAAAGDAATALRRAQLELIASHDASARSPAAWAGYELFGAVSPG